MTETTLLTISKKDALRKKKQLDEKVSLLDVVLDPKELEEIEGTATLEVSLESDGEPS